MHIFDGGDFCMAPALVVVGADAEGAAGAGAAAGADTVAVAVEDGGREAFLYCPDVEGGFEGLEGGEVLSLGYGGHGGRGIGGRVG